MKKVSDLIIHIGSPKAGSTSIQNLASTCSADLSENGIFYPKSANSGNHQFFTHKFCKDPINKGFNKVLNISEAEVSRLRKEEWSIFENGLSNNFETIIISAESLFANYKDINFEMLKKWCQEHSMRTHIVCLLRDPFSAASSLVQQLVKTGGLSSKADVRKVLRRDAVFNPYDVLDNWATWFGIESLKLYLFEEMLEAGSKQDFSRLMLSNFIKLRSTSIDCDAILNEVSWKNKKSNKSLSRKGFDIAWNLAQSLPFSERSALASKLIQKALLELDDGRKFDIFQTDIVSDDFRLNVDDQIEKLTSLIGYNPFLNLNSSFTKVVDFLVGEDKENKQIANALAMLVNEFNAQTKKGAK